MSGISATHAEYRRAKKNNLPILAFIKGGGGLKRQEGTQALLSATVDCSG